MSDLAAAPLFLAPDRLADLVDFYADECRAGSYPFVRFTRDDRWHRRIYRDQRVDVWLISWLPAQGVELHDHGGSSGAFSVVAGELTEIVPCGWADRRVSLRSTVVTSGRSVTFGRHHIHDVTNHGDVPAVSVHAYSPPLTSMSFYEIADGDVVPRGSVTTDDPEVAAPMRLVS